MVNVVIVAARYICKAFDRVNHYALLQLLMDSLLPRNFIAVLLDWFNKCFVCTRSYGVYSSWFRIIAGDIALRATCHKTFKNTIRLNFYIKVNRKLLTYLQLVSHSIQSVGQKHYIISKHKTTVIVINQLTLKSCLS